MAADFECYDDNGFATLTASTLFGRTLGTFDTGTANGALYFAGLTSAGAQPWMMSMPRSSAFVSCLPIFTISGDVVSWTFTDFYGQNNVLAPRISCACIVGTD